MKGCISAILAIGVLLPCASFSQTEGGKVTGITLSNGHVRLTFASSSGASYQSQQNDLLGNRWWNDSTTPITATGLQVVVECDGAATSRFFRVLEFTNSVFWYDWTYRYQTPCLATWGFGTLENAYHHLDKSYEWYIDQADTGAACGNNCGPSSVTMAIKWYEGSFSKTAEDARNWSYGWRGNGWWYTSDIINYLNLYSIPNATSAFTGTNQLNALILEGKVLILCISTAYLTQNKNAEERIDRFYSYASGHFLVVKGSRTVSGNLLFETYDPNNWHAVYSDGTPKGRNRHLRASELASAIQNWWNYVIVVQPAGGGGGTLELKSAWIEAVDPKTITHAWGR
jgi:hypothetical protein